VCRLNLWMDDDNNGPKYLFWISPDVKSPSNSLRLSSPVLKPPHPSLRPQAFPPSQSPCPPSPPRLRHASRAYLIDRQPGREFCTPEGQGMGYGTQAHDWELCELESKETLSISRTVLQEASCDPIQCSSQTVQKAWPGLA
jgi:hypothetical protein